VREELELAATRSDAAKPETEEAEALGRR